MGKSIGRMAGVLVLLLAALGAHRDVKPPLPATVVLSGGKAIKGSIVTCDEFGIEIQSTGDPQRYNWEELKPASAYAMFEKVVLNPSAYNWVYLGAQLRKQKEGAGLAEQAFANAMKLDPSMKEKIEKARRGEPLPGEEAKASDRADAADASRQPASRPVWGEQTEQERVNAIAELKDYTTRKLAPYGKFQALETQYFLFCTNISQTETLRWAALLDKMYGRLSELFGVEKGKNLWYGKAVIVVFGNSNDFLKFEKDQFNNKGDGYIGFCHAQGNGRVFIDFYRAPSESEFARVLVHETTHGFLHRYRSPNRVKSWANEGLAKVIEFELVPGAGDKMTMDSQARVILQGVNPMRQVFEVDRQEWEGYQIARTLTEFLLRKDKQAYVNFINGIKDGAKWKASLEGSYHETLDQIVSEYGASLGNPGLKTPPVK